jgi:transposase
VERGKGIKPVWTFTRPSEQLVEHDVRELRCGKGVKKMFWAAFGYNCRTGLLPLDGDSESVGGGVTGRVIRDVYTNFLPTIMEPNDIFMHDGASTHTAIIVRTVLLEMGITIMRWPPYSPDLNPIENLWAIMKAEIYRLRPELEYLEDTVATLALLIATAKLAWHAIEDRILYNLCTCMPDRVKAVLDAKGWYTKY